MSTNLNTMAGNIFEDLIKPCMKANISQSRSTNIIKLNVVVLSAISILLALAMENLGTIVEIAITLGGLIYGISTGMLFLGSLFPMANNKGAKYGVGAGILMALWIIIGFNLGSSRGLINHKILPLSTEKCPFNATTYKRNNQNVSLANDNSYIPYFFPLYQVSKYYNCLISCIVTLVVGLLASCMSGGTKNNQVNPDLLVPFLRKRYCKETSKRDYRTVRQEPAQGMSLLENFPEI